MRVAGLLGPNCFHLCIRPNAGIHVKVRRALCPGKCISQGLACVFAPRNKTVSSLAFAGSTPTGLQDPDLNAKTQRREDARTEWILLVLCRGLVHQARETRLVLSNSNGTGHFERFDCISLALFSWEF